jgi:hypothetical protein
LWRAKYESLADRPLAMSDDLVLWALLAIVAVAAVILFDKWRRP